MNDPQPVAVEPQDTDAAIKMLEFAFRNASTRTLRDVDLHDIALCFAEQRHRLAERARLTTDRTVGVVPRHVMERVQHVLSVVANYSDAVANGGEYAGQHLANLQAMNGDVIADDARVLAATPPVPATSGEGEKLREALGEAREIILELFHSRGCEYEGTDEDMVGFIDAALATPDAAPIDLPADVRALVIAGREFWGAHNDATSESVAMDAALEAFSARVPYDDEPAAEDQDLHPALEAALDYCAAPIGSDDADYSGYVDAGERS